VEPVKGREQAVILPSAKSWWVQRSGRGDGARNRPIRKFIARERTQVFGVSAGRTIRQSVPNLRAQSADKGYPSSGVPPERERGWAPEEEWRWQPEPAVAVPCASERYELVRVPASAPEWEAEPVLLRAEQAPCPLP
jgi:hypothetical protein